MKKIRACMVGNGGMASWHLNHLIAFEDIDLVGFCDLIPERAKGFSDKAGGGKCYTNFVEMYDEQKPDLVYICVPPAEHGAIELEAVKRGFDFFVEKPISSSIKTAEKIETAVKKAGTITAVGFQDRYLDIIELTKEYLKGREYGLVTGSWVGGMPGVAWWRTKGSGGQIVEQNIHIIDGLRYIIGEAASVYCSAGHGLMRGIENYEVDDFSSAVITFKNGVVASLLTGCYQQSGAYIQNGMTFYAKDATIEYSLRNFVRLRDANGIVERKTKIDQGITEDRTFIDAVKTRDQSIVRSPYSDAIKSLRIALACNESIETGKVITLD